MTREEYLERTIDFDDAIRRIVRFEKENAELKETIDNMINKSSATFLLQQDQLTKAKEIIKKLIEAIHIWDCKNLEEVETEAEQFLSEVEK